MDTLEKVAYRQNEWYFHLELCAITPKILLSSLGELEVSITFDLVEIKNQTLGRTSDGGNGNHSVSLPIILIKFKVNQILQSSCIS